MSKKQGPLMGSTVIVQNDNWEKALRLFKKKITESGKLMELKEKEFYEKYGDYEIKFYSYCSDNFIFGTDEKDEGNIDLTVNIEDVVHSPTLLHIYPNKKWKVSELKDLIYSASVHSKEVHHIIEEYDKYK